MSQWPTIAFVALLLTFGFMIWARRAEGESAEFAQYDLTRKLQTLALIYGGCFVLTAVGWGMVLLLMRQSAPGIDYY